MSISDNVDTASIISRAKNLIINPASEWARIDAEQTSIAKLYTGYVCILAAIPAICQALRSMLFGYSAMGITVRSNFGEAVFGAVAGYVAALLGVLVMALVIEFLAPTFGGTKDRLQAFKIAAYSGTAAWLAGIFALIPGLSILGILGLYSIYILYLGLPVLMKAPREKALLYTAAVVIVGIVIMLVISAIFGPLMYGGAMGM